MRVLTQNEQSFVAGGAGENQTNMDIFWTKYAEGAGIMAGYCSGPFIAVGAGIGVAGYYLIYTPLYYLAYGLYMVTAAAANGVYAVGAAIGNGIYSVGAGVHNAVTG